jgi:hypothetical protein
MSVVDTSVLDHTIYKLLDKAGTDPRCTPNILRSKAESKMKLEAGALESFRLRVKKLIVKWWKENQLAKPTSKKDGAKVAIDDGHDLLIEKYRAYREFAKATTEMDLLSGLKNIDEIPLKIKELKSRLKKAGYEFSSPPTEFEIRKMTKEAAEKVGNKRKADA